MDRPVTRRTLSLVSLATLILTVGISASFAGQNGARGDHGNIEENGGFTANVVVTLSEGQWFETNDCGDWSG